MSNIQMAVDVLTGRQRYAPRPPSIGPSLNVRVSISSEDDEEIIRTPEKAGKPVRDFIGHAYLLHYRDSRGAESRRRITIREIRIKQDVLHVWAFCHEREAARLFRVDRIMDLMDLKTGELVDVIPFCSGLAQEDTTRAALRELRQEIAVLAFVARCDGYFHELENAAIVEHVLDRRNYDPAIRQDELASEIGKVRADSHLFESGVVAIGRMGETRLRQFERAIIRVIDADGVIHPTEHAIAENLVDLIRDRRDVLESRK